MRTDASAFASIMAHPSKFGMRRLPTRTGVTPMLAPLGRPAHSHPGRTVMQFGTVSALYFEHSHHLTHKPKLVWCYRACRKTGGTSTLCRRGLACLTFPENQTTARCSLVDVNLGPEEGPTRFFQNGKTGRIRLKPSS